MSKITRKEIEQTEAFKSLNKLQKMFALKANNVKAINYNLTVMGYIGPEQWERETNAGPANILISLELWEKSRD